MFLTEMKNQKHASYPHLPEAYLPHFGDNVSLKAENKHGTI
jgi:hypothetical protein